MSVRKFNRRDFLKATGLSGSALALGVHVPWTRSLFAAEEADAAFAPNVYISIERDGTVRLTIHRSEMGQGVRTSCAMLLAEELDVGLSDVKIEQAPGHPKYGNQNTDGSRSIRTQWQPLRQAGAAAREMLVAAAAAAWSVPVSQCVTESGQVIHRASGQRLGYGALADKAAALPVPENPQLKAPDEFKIIGRRARLLDAPGIATGKAIYGWDVEIPGMLYASLERSPTVKGSIKRYDAEAAKRVKGVREVVVVEPHPGGLTNQAIAVVADNSWAAMQGRTALNAEWEAGPLANENSAEYRARMQEITSQPGRAVRSQGDFEAARAAAARVVEAEYHGPYLVHAPMEPPTCTAAVSGDSCEVWAPTQAPQWARSEIANLLGISEDNVTVNVTMLGGGFGRKSKPDFIMEAVALSKQLGGPVKLFWTREDEVRHGFYRAQNCQKLTATLNARGQVTGWRHRTLFPSIGWRFDPEGTEPSGGELSLGFINMPYRVPNLQLEVGKIPSSLRIGWWRSVNHTFHAFAVNSFMDELAHAAGKDPLAFHLELLGEPRILELTDQDRQNPYKFDTGRLKAVIEQVGGMGLWGRKLPERQGLGFAAHYSFLTYVAMVMHVSVDGSGNVKVHQVDCAVDCGQVVNPDTVAAQVEGATIFGLSAALHDAITVKAGAVEQSNFHDYPMLRIGGAPQVNVQITASSEMPTGIGEPGVPPVAPALTNAIFAATGKRVRELPLAGQQLG